MANTLALFGFQPTMQDMAGAPVATNQYIKGASDTHAIFSNDLVSKVAVSQNAFGSLLPFPGVQTYNLGTPGTTLILGSALNYSSPSSGDPVLVVDDPDAVFLAQCDGSTSITVAASVGKNADVNNAAQATAGVLSSAMGVLSSSIATTAGLDLRIKDIFHRISNNVEGANAIVEVVILKHQNAFGSAGV